MRAIFYGAQMIGSYILAVPVAVVVIIASFVFGKEIA